MSKYAPKNPSADDIAAIVTRYQAGESAERIAPDYGVRGATICNWLRKAGVVIRTRSQAADLRPDRVDHNRHRHQMSIAQDRTCRICHNEYSPTSARQMWCKVCVPDSKARARYQRYGITQQDYDRMTLAQNNQCALCDTTLTHDHSTAVDHCHTTGKVRGILCRGCNMVLHYYERPGFNQRVHQYLGR